MNMTSVATNILKLPPKQIQVSPDKLSISTSVSSPLVSNSICTVSSDSNDPSVNCSPVNVLKQNDVTDLSFKERNLQLLTTNAVSPFFPKISRLTKTPIELHCCSGCRDTFAFKSSLRFHLDRRSILIQFPCEACKSVQIFFNRCSLLSHIRSHENKNEPSDIEKAVVNPLPLELMIDVQTEDVNTLQDELNCMYEANEMPPSELEFSINDDDTIIIKEKPIPTNALKVKCVDCNEEFENAEARKEHLTNGGKIPVLISPCNKCGMVCPSKCSLKAHQRLHLQISPYICPECGENPDEYWEKFQNHVKYKCFHHARSIGCRCPVCKRVSPSRESVLKHMELHTEKYLKCDSCNQAYMTMLSFEDHVKEHVGKCVKVCSIYRCSLCDVVFLNTDQLLIHRTAHLKEELSVYVFNCMQCGKTVENKGQLLDHIKNSHPEVYKLISQDERIEANSSSQPTTSYIGKIECMLCFCKFDSFHDYSVHVSRAHFNMNQPCSYCFMIIENRKEMIIHGKKHLKKGNITCLLCNNMKFADKKRLDAHLSKNHVDKLEYCSVCPICNELLPTVHGALNHLRVEHFLVTKDSVNQEESDVNAGNKNVTCHFCRTALDGDAELQEHLKTKHHVDNQKQQNKQQPASEEKEQPASEEKEQPLKKQGVKENICGKCDFQSSDREVFKKHVLTHQKKKDSFQCQECGFCFVVEPSLIKHLIVNHKIKDPKKYIEEEGTNFMSNSKNTAEVFSCDSLMCSVCFASFPTRGQLKAHMRSHGLAYLAFIQADKTVAPS